ncbi:hypothetical protein BKA70DRAFT_1168325 [Coprinopsis sp. MPI-PUGE-AT-0042]|nr:hypothetical protein BKA70DRAFT_1168325 [Coprinopsis sp. MPI-PUGE-AT-0042]
MGASLSKFLRWDDTVSPGASTAIFSPPIQNSGPSLFQGAQNPTINGGIFIQNTQQVEVTSLQNQEYLQKVLDFLSLVNFRSIQQENLGKWAPGTLAWLLESSMFQFWIDSQCGILWGTGMPGAGKTILASVAIEHLQGLAKTSTDICITFVYCRYTEPMKVRDILAALVRQLLERFPHLLCVVEPMYAKHHLEKTKPTQSELINTIRDIYSRFRIAFLFIDGLDEALYDEQFDLLDTLRSVPANVFITSRPLVRLKDVLQNVEFFNIAAKGEDIELLVFLHISRNPDLRQVLAGDEDRETVINKICESSCGMFLHASLMVEAVRHCTSSLRVMEKLDKLPVKLDALYDEAFERIEMQPEEHAALAKRVLLWLAYAYRPLTVEEMRYAVASDPKVDWATPENLIPESLLVSVCCGLVIVEDKEDILSEWVNLTDLSSRIVRLVHYTALDAVKRVFEKWEMSPHCLLAELCVERIVDCGVPSGRYSYEPDPTWAWLVQPPLQNYAYESWHLHAAESIQCPAPPDARPVASVLRFLATCEAFPALDLNDIGERLIFDNFTAPIHVVTFYHLPALLPLIDGQTNERTRLGRSALSLAAWRNDAVMAGLLLSLDGIDVNMQDDDGNTALMVAAGRGSAHVVKTLLCDPRTDAHKRNKEGQTALHCAVHGAGSSGHVEAALHLLAVPGIDLGEVVKDEPPFTSILSPYTPYGV